MNFFLWQRGVVDAFCSSDVRENLFGVLRVASSFFLNPIVQTNHVQIEKEMFRIASATGATLNSQAEYDTIPRSEPGDIESAEGASAEQDDAISAEAVTTAPTTSSSTPEETTSPPTTMLPPPEEEVVNTGRSVRSVEGTGDDAEGSTSEPVTTPVATDSPPIVVASDDTDADDEVTVLSDDDPPVVVPVELAPKGGKRGSNQIESYVFDEPFLWFLHATNEEPMFMGIIESFKRYKDQGANRVISLTNNNNNKVAKDGATGSKHPIVDVIADTANINLWNC